MTRASTPPRRARALALCSAAAALGYAPGARAQDAAAGVSLELHACAGIDPGSLRRIASIDLGTAVTPEGERARTGTRITVRCEGTVAVVRVRDAVTSATLSRRVELGPPGDTSRTRLLAIAVVELVTASWVELVPAAPSPRAPAAGSTAAPASASAPVLDPVPDRVLRAPPAPPLARQTWLTAFGGVRSFVPGSLSLWGGGLALSLRQEALLGAVFDVAFEHGEAVGTPPPPRVVMDSLSVGGALVLQATGARFVARAGVGARLGLAWVSDQRVAGGATVLAPWAGPFFMIGLGVRATRRFVIDLRFEQGLALGALGPLAPRWGGSAVGNLWIAAHVGLGGEF